MNIWYRIIKFIFRIYILICIPKISVTGHNNLIKGPKIVVANHPNMTDSCVLPFIFSEKLTFLIQASTFSVPIIGFLLRKSGQIPVIKGQGKQALNIALEHLSNGQTIVIFPEGRLNHGKELFRAGSGAIVLAKNSGAPILPIGFYVSPHDTLIMKGKIQNRKTFAHFQVKGCCHVHIGRPWNIEKINKEKTNYLQLRKLTNQMMDQIGELVAEARNNAESKSQSLRYSH
ncbi:MAG: lysophospholipid acyltransferase family protein [Anaerolineales bacterium]|jgi:1-acyl-sn-glycerol-3-phosphate acyltransferase